MQHKLLLSVHHPLLWFLTIQVAKELVNFSLLGFVIRPQVPHACSVGWRGPVEVTSAGCFALR